MNNFEYIEHLIAERLGGDRRRIGELFEDEALFRELQAGAKDSDWFHFEPKTYDGQYFVQTYSGYAVYEQDRGAQSNRYVFEKLADAATHFFNAR